MFLIPIEVDSYAGYETQESPRAFRWGARRIQTSVIVDRWYGTVAQRSGCAADPKQPRADYFKVRSEIGEEYLLKRDHESGEWFLVESFARRE